MSIFKHEIPILEFDTDTQAVIQPSHERLDLHLPEKAVFAFLSTHIEEYAILHGAMQVATFRSATKDYPVYVLEHKGYPVCLCQAPVGAAPAAQILDWLISYGARQIITGGCCGTLVDMEENVFLVPCRALRDEGTSYHYAPPSRFIEIGSAGRDAIKRMMDECGLPYREVITWSTDGFYRETQEKVAYRKAEGCEVVEMECSALAACAAMRGVDWGCLLFTADTLADVSHHDMRTWGEDGFAIATELCLDAVIHMR